MAQIVTITNPLTGQPAQVDQLEHTAQEIDDAIARALPGGAIDTALQNKATAEPDVVHTLPLSESAAVVSGLSSTFSKSKFGKVSVHIACVPAQSLSAYESITVATLPEGYRPAKITELYAGLSILWKSYNLAVWQVATDGRILFTPTVAVSTIASIHGTLEFDVSA